MIRQLPRFTLTAAIIVLLASCAAVTAVKTGQPIDPAQVNRDLASITYLMQAAGCVTAEQAAIAAPVVTVSGDETGQQVLSAIGAAGQVQCRMTVPPTALPVPVPAGTPTVTVVAPAPAPTTAPAAPTS